MMMPGRKYEAATGYRYGFNAKENDNEVKGEGNQQDYGMRIYDPRLGRFLSVDPLMKSFPWFTPYQFASNMPIWAIDIDGMEGNKKPNKNELSGDALDKELDKNMAESERLDPGSTTSLRETLKSVKRTDQLTEKMLEQNRGLINRTKEATQKGAELQKKIKQSDQTYNQKIGEIESRSFLESINPIEDAEFYVSMQIKTFRETLVKGVPLKGTVPLYGFQLGATFNEGPYFDFITPDFAYAGIQKGNIEIRLAPFKGSVNRGEFGVQGMEVRTLVTYRKIDAAVIGAKVQGEAIFGVHKFNLGMRGVVETKPLPLLGIDGSVELSGGARVHFKMPKLVLDIIK